MLSEEEGYAIKVCVTADLKDDRYVINSYNTHAEIKAAKDCTVHAAVSRFFLESKFSGVGDFSPFVGQIDFTPRSSVRGMYFATHFENDEIIRSRRQVLEAFSDIQLSYIVYWPYDQGGCTCKDCEPWGVNGFLKIYPHFCSLVKEIMPQTEIILSTWLFDHFSDGEWEEFCNLLARKELDSVSYIMSFSTMVMCLNVLGNREFLKK